MKTPKHHQNKIQKIEQKINNMTKNSWQRGEERENQIPSLTSSLEPVAALRPCSTRLYHSTGPSIRERKRERELAIPDLGATSLAGGGDRFASSRHAILEALFLC